MPGKRGGIYNRGPGQWQVKIRRGSHSVSRTFEKFHDAVTWRNVTVGLIDGHEYVDRSKERAQTLTSLLKRYKKEVTPKKKGKAQECYRLDQWTNAEFAERSLTSIGSMHIAEWMEEQTRNGAAPSTISNAVNLLSAVYRTAQTLWGYKIDNPCKGISRPRARPPRQVHLSAEERAKLLAECRKGPAWLIWCAALALETGMRAGEIRRLRWDDIHDTHIHLSNTKNAETRDVPLTTAASTVVENMRTALLPHRPDGWVFGDPDIPRQDQGGFTKDMLSQGFRDAARRAQIRITFHDLRHVAITDLARLHRNVLELAAMTGHKTLNVLKHYYNPSPAERAAEIRRREAELAQRNRPPGA